VIVGLGALLASAGCSGRASSSPDGGPGPSVNGGAHAGGAGNASGASSLPSSAGRTNIGGSSATGGLGNAASGSGGTSSAGQSAGSDSGGTIGAGSGGTIGVGQSGGAAGRDLPVAGAAGSPSATGACGGPTGIYCPTGQFCDLASDCGAIAAATGICVAIRKIEDCDDVEGPQGSVCGCDGKNYVNACQRQASSMLQASVGACPNGGIASYPKAYGVWQAPRGDGGVGPAVVVSGASSIRIWESAFAFAPETPPPNPTSFRTLTLADSDDLFLRLAGVPTASLPHPPAIASSCRPTFSFRLCDGCPTRSVDYDTPAQVLPEMESIWLWFDRILGASAPTNPRNFCPNQ
jgi:hypothetical protein